MGKEGTGINLLLEAQILGYRNKKRWAIKRAQLRWFPYVWLVQQQLNEIEESIDFNKSIGQLDTMLATLADSESGELVKRTRQIILTYAEIWNVDIQSGHITNYLSFDFSNQMEELKTQLGAEEFEKQWKTASDWHTEMRQRVQMRFAEILGEIRVDSHIPTSVLQQVITIQNKLGI